MRVEAVTLASVRLHIRASHLDDVRNHLAVDPTLADAQDQYGRTPLHWAAYAASAPILTLLLEDYHVDPNAPDRLGETALHWIVGAGTKKSPLSLACLRVLLDHGADPTRTSIAGTAPLHLLVQRAFHWAHRAEPRAEPELFTPRFTYQAMAWR